MYVIELRQRSDRRVGLYVSDRTETEMKDE